MSKEDSDKETLRFLFDKRLELFNVRRDHEWKIFFGVIGLIGLADAALVTKAVHLNPSAIPYWRAALVVLFIASVTYEFGIQTRNRVDRLAMDELYELLCNSTDIPPTSFVRIPIDRATERHLGRKKDKIIHYTYLWAFTWQTLTLLMLCIISWMIPDLMTVNEATQ